MIFDGGREYEGLQQREHPSGKSSAEKYDPVGTEIIDRNFCGICEYVDRLVRTSLPQSASLTAPSSEGALDAAASKQ